MRISAWALFGVALAACAFSVSCRRPGPADGGVIELNFWNGFSGPDGATMEAIVRQYNAEHPGVHVKMQIIPWATYYDKLTLSLAFGGAPDVFVLHVNRFPEYASHQAMEPIDDLLRKTGLTADQFMPKPWNATLWRGVHYAIPLDCHPLGLYCNLDLLQKAGIAKPPQTLDEFVRDAKLMTRDTDGDGKPDQWGFSFTWVQSNTQLFLYQFGTDVLTPDLKRSALSTPQAFDAVSLMRRFIDQDRICPKPEGTDAWMGFRTGKVAMAMEGVYMMSSLKDQAGLRWTCVPVPQFGPVRAVWAGSHTLNMPRGISGARREAAWSFIKYLSDHSLEWAKGGQVPVRRAILASPQFKALPVQSALSSQLPYIVYEPKSVSYNQISPFFNAAFDECLNGDHPREALDLATRRINEVLSRE